MVDTQLDSTSAARVLYFLFLVKDTLNILCQRERLFFNKTFVPGENNEVGDTSYKKKDPAEQASTLEDSSEKQRSRHIRHILHILVCSSLPRRRVPRAQKQALSGLNILEQARKKPWTDDTWGCLHLSSGGRRDEEHGGCPSDTKQNGPKTREYPKPLI